jgi:hypothetical protein
MMKTERILRGSGRDRLWHCPHFGPEQLKKSLDRPRESRHRGRKSQLPPPRLRGFKVSQPVKEKLC